VTSRVSRRGVCHDTSRDTVGWADQGTWAGPGLREDKDRALQYSKEESKPT